jgi:hypothetical protein
MRLATDGNGSSPRFRAKEGRRREHGHDTHQAEEPAPPGGRSTSQSRRAGRPRARPRRGGAQLRRLGNTYADELADECEELADYEDDDYDDEDELDDYDFDLSDGIAILSFLFLAGPPPAPP